jgi:short-subunit dehydrogenase
MRTIRSRRAVVTGAASGIGRAIALALAAEGADLFLIDRNADELQAIAQEVANRGVTAIIAVCDLALPAEITRAIGELRARWNGVNILVNCAGVGHFGPYHLTPEEIWRRTVAVNLLAPMQIIHELLPTLFGADEAHILNVCSFMGLVPWKKVAAYQASKYGLVGFTLALRSDYCRHNFGVTALCPGFVRTAMLDVQDPEPHRQAPSPPAILSTTPDAVATAAVAAIRRNRGLVLVTPFARMAWWATRLSPSFVDWLNRESWRRRGDIPRQDGAN